MTTLEIIIPLFIVYRMFSTPGTDNGHLWIIRDRRFENGGWYGWGIQGSFSCLEQLTLTFGVEVRQTEKLSEVIDHDCKENVRRSHNLFPGAKKSGGMSLPGTTS